MTGQSKGYGMVRYSCSQAAAQAKHLLDNRQVNGTKIQVMILKQIVLNPPHKQHGKTPSGSSTCQNCHMESKYFLFLLWILQIGLYVKSLKIEFV